MSPNRFAVLSSDDDEIDGGDGGEDDVIPLPANPTTPKPGSSRLFDEPDSSSPGIPLSVLVEQRRKAQPRITLSLPPSSPPSSPTAPPAERDPNELDSDDRAFLALQSSPYNEAKRKRKGKEKATEKRLETLRLKRVVEEESEETQRLQLFDEVLSLLEEGSLDLGDLLFHVLNPENKQGELRWALFRKPNFMKQLLDYLAQGNDTMRSQLLDWSTAYIRDAVQQEARSISESKELHTSQVAIDSTFVSDFSITEKYKYLIRKAPVFMQVARGFATSARHAAGSPLRELKKVLVLTSTSLTLLREYSRNNNIMQKINTLYLYATGAQRQVISVLSSLGITESYTQLTRKICTMTRRKRRPIPPQQTPRALDVPPSTPVTDPAAPYIPDLDAVSKRLEDVQYTLQGTLSELSGSARTTYRSVAHTGLFGGSYDNINWLSKSAEQILGRSTSQENGTCATIFALWNARLEDMKVTDLQASFDAAQGLSLDDILHTPDEAAFMDRCLRHTILRIIVEHGGEGFAKFKARLEATQPWSDDVIEVHKTTLYPLTGWPIDESTIAGNADVVEAISEELHLSESPHFETTVRLLGGDQLSIARLRSLVGIRAGHETGFPSFSWGVWIPGLFHAKIADMHGFFQTHWGIPNRGTRNPGSLSFHNTVLNRTPIVLTSLPPFRTCRDLTFVSLYARVLHCLQLVCERNSLDECADAVTSWDDLVLCAGLVYERYADAAMVADLRAKRQQASDDEASFPGDMIFENAVLFMRDALISREFTNAIKAGDSGRIVLILKLMALGFRGSGRTKYAHEMLHLIHNLTHVWPPAIRKIVLDNWLLDPSGNPMSFVEVDLMQEHMNFWIKVFYQAHGSAASWEWVQMISPCVSVLRDLSTMMRKMLGSDIGTQHQPANLVHDIAALMDSLEEHEVYAIKGRVMDAADGISTVDIIQSGLVTLMVPNSSPLIDYNEDFAALQRRRRQPPVNAVFTLPVLPSEVLPADNDAVMDANVFDAAQSDPATPPGSPSEADGDDDDSLARQRESLLNLLAEEPTLTRDRAEDVALDMDIDESRFIFDDALQDDLEEGGFEGMDIDRFDESYDEY